MTLETNFSANLRAARARADLTQTQLARLCGYGQTNVSKWDTGKSTPTVDQLLVIANALGTTAADLLQGCTLPPRPPTSPAHPSSRTRRNPLPASGTLKASRPEPPLVTRRARRPPPQPVA